MGMMIRSFFPEPHLALLRLIEYADHEPMSQSQQKQVSIFACKGIAVTIHCRNNTVLCNGTAVLECIGLYRILLVPVG
jgi:hypothetical protein